MAISKSTVGAENGRAKAARDAGAGGVPSVGGISRVPQQGDQVPGAGAAASS